MGTEVGTDTSDGSRRSELNPVVVGGTGLVVAALILLSVPWRGAAEPEVQAGPVVAVRTHTPAPVDPGAADVCLAAQRMVADGYPQRARDLVVDARAAQPGGGSPCPAEHRLALTRVIDASVMARQAARLLAAKDLDGADALAVDALEVDVENEKAREVRDGVKAARAPDVVAYWADLLPDVEHPLDVGLLAAGIVAVCAVLARFAVAVVSRWPRMSGGQARFAMAVGLAVAGLGAFGVAVTVTARAGPQTWQAFWTAAGAAALGAAVLAVGMATRLRLTIEAFGSAGAADPTLTGRVIALLGELGAEAPRGIEMPHGADADALAGSALSDLPEGRWAKVAVALARSVFAVTPWRVTVNAQADGALAVTMTRNGRAAGSAVVSADLLRLPDDDAGRKAAKECDLYRFAAAFVLVTLARAHWGFRGLGGASEWRSLGLHAIATTDLARDDAHAKHLLATAVEQDRGNWLAQVALRNQMWREATQQDDLDRYLTWLRAAAEATREHPTIRLRVLTTRALVAVNHLYAKPEKVGAAGVRDLAPVIRDLVDEVRQHLERVRRTPARALAEQVQPTAYALVAMLGGAADRAAGLALPEGDDATSTLVGLRPDLPVDGWGEPPTLHSEYTLACTYATLAGLGLEGMAERAVAKLRLARVDSRVAAWVEKDPQLAGLRASDTYRRELAVPRTDLLAVPPFGAHADRLRALGLDDVRCALAGVDPLWLAAVAPMAEPAARMLVQMAQLARGLVDEPLATYRAELVAALADDDRACLDALGAQGRSQRADLADRAARKVIARCGVVPKIGLPACEALATAPLAILLRRALERTVSAAPRPPV